MPSQQQDVEAIKDGGVVIKGCLVIAGS